MIKKNIMHKAISVSNKSEILQKDNENITLNQKQLANSLESQIPTLITIIKHWLINAVATSGEWNMGNERTWNFLFDHAYESWSTTSTVRWWSSKLVSLHPHDKQTSDYGPRIIKVLKHFYCQWFILWFVQDIDSGVNVSLF